jgi:nucleotidyltransferase/DNA polymerase involved in DNA repair
VAERIVLHVDLDAFYASVEQRDNPALRGLPVIVGADPQNGQGRGVVAAASYEARKFGVRSAMPITQAWRRCPEGVYLRPDFRRYHAASARVMAILAEAAEKFEPASIDEAYLDLTGRVGDFAAAHQLAEALQRRIRAEEGLTVSIGIGPNKLVAKIATDLRKPNGITVIRPEHAEERLAPLPASRIPGIGPKTADHAESFGIKTIGDIVEAPDTLLRQVFGSFAAHARDAARGLDDTPVDGTWLRKSVGTERTFEKDVLSPEEVHAAVRDCAREGQAALRRERLHCRTVVLKVRRSDFTTLTRSKSLPAPIAHRDALEAVARELLDSVIHDCLPVRLVGVRLTNLLAMRGAQATLDPFLGGPLGAHR